MANRYYSVLNNGTPENKKILEMTMALDARQNVTGEPTYLWKVPNLHERPTLKGSGYANDPAPRVLGGGILQEMDEREPMRRPRGMVSPYTQPPNEYVLAGTRAYYPYYNAVELDTINRKTLKGGLIDENDLEELRRMGYRPKKDKPYMPKIDPSKINPEAVAYANSKREMERAKYRAKKLKAQEEIDGAGIFTAAGKEAAKAAAKKAAKEAAKAAAKAAAEAAKLAAKGAAEAAKLAAKTAAEAAKLGVAGAKQAAKGAVALASNKEFQEVVGQIAADKDIQKLVVDQITNLVKPKPKDEPVTETPVEDEEEEVKGGRIKRKSPRGKTDGRAKRAEIVKQVMRDKGLKMIEASKYVKVHKLY